MTQGLWGEKHNFNETKLYKTAMGKLKYKINLAIFCVQTALVKSKCFKVHFVFPDESHRVLGNTISLILLHCTILSVAASLLW